MKFVTTFFVTQANFMHKLNSNEDIKDFKYLQENNKERVIIIKKEEGKMMMAKE